MTNWLLRNSLWIAAIGLCLASSGIDGQYMAAWMPAGLDWLGYVLNTVADLTGMVIMHHYSRLQQTRRNETGGKRRLQLSRVLLGVEVIAVGYSWLLSWRQLRIVLPAIEPVAWPWVSLVAAGFVPLLLAFVGYTQGLLAGRIEDAQPAQVTQVAEMATEAITETAQASVAFSDNGKDKPYRICPLCNFTAQSPQAWAGHCKGREHKRRAAEAAPVLTEFQNK